MSRALKFSALGGIALVLGGVTWLWGVRGVAIVLDYAFVGCL
jgi:hypothetical protein